MNDNSHSEAQAAHAPGAMLTESGKKLFGTYGLWIVAAAWLMLRVYALWGLSPNFYVESYLKIAGDWLDGFTPYAAFQVEYPPGALMLFALPRLFTETPVAYGYIFAAVMLLADLAILYFLWRIPTLLNGDAADDTRSDRVYRSPPAILCLTYVLFTAVFDRLLYQGYELLIGLMLTASIYFALRKKHIGVDLLLALGIWLSLSAVVWVPLLWWYGFVSRNPSNSSDRNGRKSEFLGYFLIRTAVLGGGLIGLYLPFFLYSGSTLFQIVKFQLERGTQLESTAASLLIAGSKIFEFELATDFTQRAIHLSGEIGSQAAAASGTFSICVVVILTIIIGRRLWVQETTAARNAWLVRGLLATILALLAVSKIFLPQYLLWVSPLAVLLACGPDIGMRRIGGQLFAVNLVSAVIFFYFYPDLIEFHALPGLLLLIRNIIVIYAVIRLLMPASPIPDRVSDNLQTASKNSTYLLYAAILLVFVWGTAAAFRPIRNADVWMHLRVAQDILASGEIPRIDQYSAVAAGRPHLSHEWLSALVFLGIYKIGGGEALSVFRAATMLGMMLLLWFSLEKRARRFVLTIPLMALSAYIILERVFVRPHIFTLLFLCIWVFCLERWRLKRHPAYLIALVPLQVLWANLHGGYIIAVVMGAMLTGTTALLAWRPSWSTGEPFTWSDVSKLAALTAACLAASLINPHGFQLLEFSLKVGVASDYIKQYVYEWGSPLAQKYAGRAYGFDVGFGLLALMWLGLVLGWRRRPLIDAAQALLATALTVQAIRFVSFIGILGLPITVRAWQAVADTHLKSRAHRPRPLIEAALLAVLLASTLIYGFAYDKSNHRRIGWGFGARLPYKSVEFLAERKFKGIIFNDYTDGAYILHHLAPDVRPVMDSRIDVYGNDLTHEYFSSRDDPIKFFQYLNKYNVSLILLMQTKKNIPVIKLLSQLPASNLLLRADERFLFSYDPNRLPAEIRQRLTP